MDHQRLRGDPDAPRLLALWSFLDSAGREIDADPVNRDTALPRALTVRHIRRSKRDSHFAQDIWAPAWFPGDQPPQSEGAFGQVSWRQKCISISEKDVLAGERFRNSCSPVSYKRDLNVPHINR